MKSELLAQGMRFSLLVALAFVSSPLSGAGVIVTNSDDLPPSGGAGWYSAPGQSVSFYVDYGTNQGLPADKAFRGVFIAARDMIVDNFQNINRSYQGNDEVIQFDAQLTASVTTLQGLPLSNPLLLTLAGSMQVRLTNRLGHATGTFPLTVEALSFTLTLADIGGSTNTPMANIRISPGIISGGQLSVQSAGGGKYEVNSNLSVYSEMAVYYPDQARWLPYWPDQNVPTAYILSPLQGPKEIQLSVVAGSGVNRDVYLEFPMRKYASYIVDRSPDMSGWTPLDTNAWTGAASTFSLVHTGGGNGPKGFYRIRTSLQPAQ